MFVILHEHELNNTYNFAPNQLGTQKVHHETTIEFTALLSLENVLHIEV